MDKLERLIAGLDAAGVKKYGRNKRVAEATGYSPGMVAKIMSGHVALTDRFIQAVCSSFYIKKEWIYDGIMPINNQGFDLEGAIDSAKIKKEEMQDQNINKLYADLDKLKKERDELKAKQSKIESDFVKYRDLIVAFMYIPVEEMDDAIEVLRAVQKLTADNPGLVAPPE